MPACAQWMFTFAACGWRKSPWLRRFRPNSPRRWLSPCRGTRSGLSGCGQPFRFDRPSDGQQIQTPAIADFGQIGNPHVTSGDTNVKIEPLDSRHDMAMIFPELDRAKGRAIVWHHRSRIGYVARRGLPSRADGSPMRSRHIMRVSAAVA